MITVLARFEMLEGKEIEVIEAIRKMAAAVKANEPGCLVYTASRGKVNGSELYFFEIYENEKAFQAHARTDHMREMRAAMNGCIDNSTFNIESLDQVGGFIRHEMDHSA
jgi:quinol monooxygenase YgiN